MQATEKIQKNLKYLFNPFKIFKFKYLNLNLTFNI